MVNLTACCTSPSMPPSSIMGHFMYLGNTVSYYVTTNKDLENHLPKTQTSLGY